MTTKLNVLQVIPKLGYGGAETGCYDIAHFLSENDCGSFLATSGGELIKFVKKDKVKLIRLPVHSKNPLLIFFNTLVLIIYIFIPSLTASFSNHNNLNFISSREHKSFLLPPSR